MSGSSGEITLRLDWPAFRVCLAVHGFKTLKLPGSLSIRELLLTASTRQYTSIQLTFLKPENMPKVKTEKPERSAPYDVEKKKSENENKSPEGENKLPEVEKKPAEGEKKSSGWGSGGQLFGTESTELTFQGAGFKDKDKALETLKLLDGRDISYQFQIINSMYHRAKVILKRTKDTEKVHNLSEASQVFENWLNDYRAHSRSKENFSYLPLEIMEAYLPLAERYGVQMASPGSNFLQAFKAVDGDLKRLRMVKVDREDEKSVTWDVQRNNHLRELSERIKKEHLPLFETDMEYRGLPTKEHAEMIIWSYSSEVPKIKKTIPLITQKLNVSNNVQSIVKNNSENNMQSNGENNSESNVQKNGENNSESNVQNKEDNAEAMESQ